MMSMLEKIKQRRRIGSGKGLEFLIGWLGKASLRGACCPEESEGVSGSSIGENILENITSMKS